MENPTGNMVSFVGLSD